MNELKKQLDEIALRMINDRKRISLEEMEKRLDIVNMNDKLMLQVTVHYQGFHSALEIDLSEYNNDDSYLEAIKDHINIAKHVIDTKIRNKNE